MLFIPIFCHCALCESCVIMLHDTTQSLYMWTCYIQITTIKVCTAFIQMSLQSFYSTCKPYTLPYPPKQSACASLIHRANHQITVTHKALVGCCYLSMSKWTGSKHSRSGRVKVNPLLFPSPWTEGTCVVRQPPPQHLERICLSPRTESQTTVKILPSLELRTWSVKNNSNPVLLVIRNTVAINIMLG